MACRQSRLKWTEPEAGEDTRAAEVFKEENQKRDSEKEETAEGGVQEPPKKVCRKRFRRQKSRRGPLHRRNTAGDEVAEGIMVEEKHR